jgi:hypothetical protein
MQAKGQSLQLLGALAALTAAEEREQALKATVTDLENQVQHLEEKCKEKGKSVKRVSCCNTMYFQICLSIPQKHVCI